MSHIHIIDGHTRRRAAVSRSVLQLGFHAEIYEDYYEFSAQRGTQGLLLAVGGHASMPIASLKADDVGLPVIIYAEHPDTCDVVDAIRAGALDYLEWPTSTARLRRALQRAEEGNHVRMAQSQKRTAAKKAVNTLSPRELDVLLGVVAGGSNKSIAEALVISPRTVEIHRGNLMRKLNAGSTGEAVRIALYAGLDKDFEAAA